MSTRALISPKGEAFAYVRGDVLYTLEGERTGRIRGKYIVDLNDKPVWELRGDGVYALNGSETIGFLSEPRRDDDY